MSAYDKNDPKHPSYAERAFDRYDDFIDGFRDGSSTPAASLSAIPLQDSEKGQNDD